MVVEDDDVEAELVRVGNFDDRRDAAVGSDEEVRAHLPQLLHGAEVQAVAFGEAVRDVVDAIRAERFQPLIEDGDGSDAIDIEVAVESDGLVSFDCLADAGDGLVHPGQFERVVIRGEMGLVEQVGLGASGDAAGSEHGCDDGREVGDAVLMGVGVPEPPTRFRQAYERGHWRGRYFRKTRLALCPPKPRELVMTASSEPDRATFGT